MVVEGCVWLGVGEGEGDGEEGEDDVVGLVVIGLDGGVVFGGIIDEEGLEFGWAGCGPCMFGAVDPEL